MIGMSGPTGAQVEGTEKGKKKEKGRREKNDPEGVEIGVLRMLEDGHSLVEVMAAYDLSIDQMKRILQDYSEMRALLSPQKAMDEIVLGVANLFGESIRNGCTYFDSERNVCTYYSLYDVDEDLRRSCPTLFRGAGGKVRWNVGSHPWVCALCRKGVRG